jgi:hypothetical protein
MLSSHRFAIRLSILGLLIALPALASAPDPSQCTVPDLLTLVGRNGGGTVDPAAPFTVVVRRPSGLLMEGASVVLDFSACTDLRICVDQGNPNVIVDCQYHTVRGLTDHFGQVTLRVAGSAANNGASPGPTGPALVVYADGVFLKTVRVAAFDENGASGVDGDDQSAWLADFLSGQSYARSDFDGDGILSGNDLSLWVAAFFSGASAVGCGGATCP